MEFDLPLVWASLIAFAVLAYVLLDGFDLGVGILFPFFSKGTERDYAMNTVAPVWDGNETWLVLGGGGLFATFPLAYAVVLPALYAPLTVMLLGLIFRGVAFEYRWRSEQSQGLWDLAFTAGSVTAAFCQGIALGALIQGIPVAERGYAGGWWNWLTPFSLLTGVAVVVGYALLGSTWLVMKTTGSVRQKAHRIAGVAGFGTLLLIGGVSLWTPFLDPIFMSRWFAFPQILYVVPVPILVAIAAFVLFRGLQKHNDGQPFFAVQAIFVLSYLGLGISFFPYIVPPAMTIWEAAAPDESLLFLLVGAAVLIPLILAYTAYAYWVFRGKVDPSEGYH
ncbi:cytochrome d ubiquinol oxidase subunit II [Pelagibius sp. Alg239-R121]|uniref:cytochrome d ubiquinol oxidase subunit II n=1 Tax=Pelagibius sp. Alg239-R121 TaxID=2993448 RepID=UPI0024A66AAD|nr:cytochrome d ubiquinol oxidase subunit II [Pelagibius sp. Alg239-R121]